MQLKRLFIVGPMGVGKTTVGKLLASELGLRFLDSDREIERRTGTNISWIFDVEGEKGFRDREEQVLEDLTNETNVLIATGGGAVLRERNRENLKIRGLVIYLNADLTLLVKRTKDETKRPLLKGKSAKKVLEKILRERGSLYKEVSDLEVKVTEKSIKNTVAEILKTLQEEAEFGKA
ncbi:MAG: shikimate kinase AroK [Pseudomonadota bacterium]|nr:shikimate kinase AroK [Pseudomonadota bacterium]